MPWRRLRDRNYDPKLKEILPGQTVGFDISWFSLVSLLALQTRVCCLDLQCICYVRLLWRPTQDWKVAGLGSFASSSTPRLRLLLCFSERDVWSRQSSTSFMPCKQSYICRETKSSLYVFASLGRFLEDLLKGTSSLLSQRQITPLYNSLDYTAAHGNDFTSICWFSTMISSFQKFPFRWEDDKVGNYLL